MTKEIMTIQQYPNGRRIYHVVWIVILASGIATPAWAAMGDQLFKLTVSDEASFYGPVALSGNLALFGHHLFDASTGHYLYDLNALSVLTSGDYDVAIDGNRALISDRATLAVDHAGYVFDTINGQQLKRLVPGGASFGFGNSAAISGNWALIGASANFPGGAYLFDVSTGQRVFRFSGPHQSNGFGSSVALTGSLALIGANLSNHNGINPGSAYLFNVATRQELLKLTADDASDKDRFGSSVAFDGNLALVGAWANNPTGPGTPNGVGAAYVFDLTTGQQLRKLTASDGQAGDGFGSSVAISGNIALVTGGGSSYLFDVTTGQELFVFGVGGDVALSGNRALISGGGAAYVFDITRLAPGDFNADGNVDGADFVAWQAHFPLASGATLAMGDANGDGAVDGADFVIWQTNFPTLGASALPVPEPGAIVLALLSVAGLTIQSSCCDRRQHATRDPLPMNEQL